MANGSWTPVPGTAENRSMINHTMIVSFDQPLPDGELDRYLADIERVLLEIGRASCRERVFLSV